MACLCTEIGHGRDKRFQDLLLSHMLREHAALLWLRGNALGM